jgi:hypothetical protein
MPKNAWSMSALVLQSSRDSFKQALLVDIDYKTPGFP